MAIYPTSLDIDNYVILQDTDDYAFTQDSVFLVNTANITKNDRVLDLGCGTGVLSTIASIKYNAKEVVGIDVQSRLVSLATKSAKINNLQDRLTFINADVKDIRDVVESESFDKVLCNPPYFANTTNREIMGREISRTESSATLQDFVKAASYALKFGGELHLVIKVDRLASAYSYLVKYNLSPKHTTFVYPTFQKGIDVCLIRAKKGAKEGMSTSTLIVMDDDGNYTEQYTRLYK